MRDPIKLFGWVRLQTPKLSSSNFGGAGTPAKSSEPLKEEILRNLKTYWSFSLPKALNKSPKRRSGPFRKSSMSAEEMNPSWSRSMPWDPTASQPPEGPSKFRTFGVSSSFLWARA